MIKILNEKTDYRLNEMAYTTTIIDLIKSSRKTGEFDRIAKFILDTWPDTRDNYEIDSIKSLVEVEIEKYPKQSRKFSELSDEEVKDFWNKVEYFDKKLGNK